MNRNFTALCAALLMCAILIVFYGSLAFAKSTMTLAETLTPQKRVIYLTFDDGPSDRVTPQILDVLKDEDVRATFFIVGRNGATRTDILRREVNEGHTVAVHSYTHEYKEIYSSPDALLKDIDRCNAVIERVTGKKSGVYRFPGGSFGLSERFIDAVTSHGMRYVDWNASTRDAEIQNATPAALFDAAINTPANRENIVLLAHDAYDKVATAQALKDIIGYYKDLDYTFATF